MTPRAAILLTVVLSVLFFMPFASADGMGFMRIDDPDMRGWAKIPEGKQFAAINYVDGEERMIISVRFSELRGEEAFWLFPVPAIPEETDIGIIRGFPAPYGNDIEKDRLQAAARTFDFMKFSQVYPAPFLLIGSYLSGYVGDMGGFPTLSGIGDASSVTVYEHTESMGITSELVTAKDSRSLSSYLQARNVMLPDDVMPILDEEYMGKNYSFVITWISDVEAFKNASPATSNYYRASSRGYDLGVYVSFPTEKMYFPLRPTSVYGNLTIPIAIYVMGHVTPELYPGISSAEVTYFTERNYDVRYELSEFFGGAESIQKLNYTKINLNPVSEDLTEDLWIRDEPPPKLAAGEAIVGTVLIWWPIVFILISMLSSLLAGMVEYKNHSPNLKKFALFGLANTASIVGLCIIAQKMRIDRRFTKYEHKEPHLNIKGYVWKSLLVAGGIFFLMGGPFLVLMTFSASMGLLFIPLLLFSALFLLILFLVWSYNKNGPIFYFGLFFTIFFMVITSVAQYVMVTLL